jgi:hypothetical protein
MDVAWQGGTPATLFLRLDVRQGGSEKGMSGILYQLTIRRVGRFFLKKNFNRDLSKKYFKKKSGLLNNFPQKPAHTFPAKKKELRELSRNFKSSLR